MSFQMQVCLKTSLSSGMYVQASRKLVLWKLKQALSNLLHS